MKDLECVYVLFEDYKMLLHTSFHVRLITNLSGVILLKLPTRKLSLLRA